jgi:hypothetical protein
MEKQAIMPVEVRAQLTAALQLDLGGPEEGHGDGHETLPQRPSTWYLTGFLVPLEASPDQKTDEQGTDDLDEVGDTGGLDDAAAPEPAAARVRYLPSSTGASVLVPADAQWLTLRVRWGDYTVREARENEPGPFVWQRRPREEGVSVEIPEKTNQPIDRVCGAAVGRPEDRCLGASGPHQQQRLWSAPGGTVRVGVPGQPPPPPAR